MESYNEKEFWQFSDQLRLQTANFSSLSIADSIWSPHDRRNSDPVFSPPPPLHDPHHHLFFNNNNNNNNSSSSTWKNSSSSSSSSPGLIGSGKLAFGTTTTTNADRYNSFPNSNSDAKHYSTKNNANAYNGVAKTGNYYNSGEVKNYFNKSIGRPASNNSHGHGHGKKNGGDGGGKKKNSNNNNNNNNAAPGAAVDKRFKTLPASEALPRNEAIGGYIFVCNNDTMEENLKRELFGLPSRYRDSVRAIRPGLPLFLYNYSTHQLHGIFEAASFGGTNIDPTAWEDKKCPGESRFPAQVRVATRKICDPLEEDAFRPILHHYDGPKFRLELSVPEALSLLDIFADKDA